MGLFSNAESGSLDLDEMTQANFEKPFSAKQQNGYGVDKAIELIRELPKNDLRAVIGIVIHTLESMDINVGAIIQDAEQKESRVAQRIQFLKKEIDELSSKIKKYGDEISSCRTEMNEVSAIKKLLQSDDAAGRRDELDDEPEDALALIGEEAE